MADEMLCCDIDEFLHHYAPFCPTDDSIDSALEKLKHSQILTENGWRDLCGREIPSQTSEKETKVFKRLAFIVEALTEQQCFGTDSKAPRECNFNYHDCGDTHLVGEIAGSTFRIDAYFLPASSPPPSKKAKVVVSQVAVAAELKKNEKDSYDVRTQIRNIDIS